jgi:hypothetical protein
MIGDVAGDRVWVMVDECSGERRVEERAYVREVALYRVDGDVGPILRRQADLDLVA